MEFARGANWLRSLLHDTLDPRGTPVGTHSLKASLLSMAAKYGLPHSQRKLLGYHAGSKEQSMLCYSRDSMAEPLRQMCEMIRAVKNKAFLPDCSRSGRFPLKELGEEVIEGDELSDSSSSGSENEEETHHESEESACEKLLGQWQPATVEPMEEKVFVRHRISRCIHALADETGPPEPSEIAVKEKDLEEAGQQPGHQRALRQVNRLPKESKAGERKKLTSFLCSHREFAALELYCDGQHEHLPWGIAEDGAFSTSHEAEYPKALCVRYAEIFHELCRARGIVPVQQASDEVQKLAPNQQPKGRKLPQLNKASRANELCDVLDRILQSKKVVVKELPSTLGKLQFAEGQLWGRTGRLALSELRRHEKSGCAERWQVDGKSHVVGLVELYAAVTAFNTWADILQDQRLICFTDSWPVLDALVKGNSPVDEWRDLLLIFENLDERINSMLWMARVASKSNPADAPSRFSLRELSFLERLQISEAVCPIKGVKLKSYVACS
ncbi:unnamed protein product [Cladocopium goreaui]|uniref:Uncharacterized protein n=1 Tax=Cladocopium goreaui TaxID=2562237 RepID=A0A9P1BLS5_9DINO|nr:unnamed protein product [Cladocopium goreaui]